MRLTFKDLIMLLSYNNYLSMKIEYRAIIFLCLLITSIVSGTVLLNSWSKKNMLEYKFPSPTQSPQISPTPFNSTPPSHEPSLSPTVLSTDKPRIRINGEYEDE
jgi:hypothetical protein